ncbi:AtpZ/AtpI family protein [Actibacterium sp. MT2.3-13A]|uniref:AtpZ/AtpI family protein n=1 Tax=Actibacterium sp. MT2.3-13A TaxID=2828332 RepID=UPI001BAD14FC
MVDPVDKERLRQLDARIAELKRAQQPEKRHQDEHYSQANIAWRMVTELVAGLGIGFGIGYGLDSLFGTMPLFLVLFVFLGFAAGIKTMLRTAEEVRRKQSADKAGDDGDQA